MAEGQPIDEIIVTRLSNGEVQYIASTPRAAQQLRELFPGAIEGISPQYQRLHDDMEEQLHVETHVFHGGFGNPTRLDSQDN